MSVVFSIVLIPCTNVTRDYCLPCSPFWGVILHEKLHGKPVNVSLCEICTILFNTQGHWLAKWSNQNYDDDDVGLFRSVQCVENDILHTFLKEFKLGFSIRKFVPLLFIVLIDGFIFENLRNKLFDFAGRRYWIVQIWV